MDAVTILEKFIDSRAGIEEIVSPQQLSKWFPKNTNSTSLQILSQYLQEDRNEITQRIKDNIKEEFSVPLEDIISKEQQQEIEEVEQLVHNLESLANVSQVQEQVLDDQTERYTQDIKIMLQSIEMLLDKSGRLQAVPEEYVSSSIESLNKIVTNGN